MLLGVPAIFKMCWSWSLSWLTRVNCMLCFNGFCFLWPLEPWISADFCVYICSIKVFDLFVLLHSLRLFTRSGEIWFQVCSSINVALLCIYLQLSWLTCLKDTRQSFLMFHTNYCLFKYTGTCNLVISFFFF